MYSSSMYLKKKSKLNLLDIINNYILSSIQIHSLSKIQVYWVHIKRELLMVWTLK